VERILYPKFIEEEGRIFVEELFEKKRWEGFREQHVEEQAQAAVNYFSMQSFIGYEQWCKLEEDEKTKSGALACMEYLARRMAELWEILLAKNYPDKSFNFVVQQGEEGVWGFTFWEQIQTHKQETISVEIEKEEKITQSEK